MALKPFYRRAYDEILETLLSDGSAVFVAPTGYGKSKGTPYLKKRLEEEWNLPRTVHVFPLRSLVQSQMNYLRTVGLEPCHASGLPVEGKCPYMSGEFVTATIDYFSLTINRLPPPELPFVLRKWSYGHYEYPRANLFTSLILLDEVHLIGETWEREESRSREFLFASLETMNEFKVPFVVATATLPSKFLKKVMRKTGRAVVVCNNCYEKLGNKVVRFRDSDYYHSQLSIKWRTELVSDPIGKYVKENVESLLDEAYRGKLLVVSNTVNKAFEIYQILSKRLNPKDVVLVHGRLSSNDKANAVTKIESARVVISTQVIEAGVDVDATTLVTEVAPPSSLAQRAGRLCRLRMCDEAKVIITNAKQPYPYEQATLNESMEFIRSALELNSIQWRLLDNEGGISYLNLIEKVEGSVFSSSQYRSLFELLMQKPFPNVEDILETLKNYCSFVRDTNLISIEVDDNDFVETSLSWFLANLHVFARDGKLLVTFHRGDDREAKWVDVKEFENSVKGNECRGYYEFLRKNNALFATFHGEDLYVKGIGLGVGQWYGQ
ncbi:hypothetical protein EYM_02725 [Ignicoccus islandicus DSM 13165]|uniref:Helicase C-terminal domain-containing protein n=1 Tax=Ignicoccus islandicus DSM 13165 TaxID=940295 RepID=A0A0U3FS75_9CREN|nr:CRISPR-associated helicase Cas3' [Ignicoccus islandicus]ALU12352.1 hypothetical protein EYM_02725 [Ignicoccus islandicus DSM 13165]